MSSQVMKSQGGTLDVGIGSLQPHYLTTHPALFLKAEKNSEKSDMFPNTPSWPSLPLMRALGV